MRPILFLLISILFVSCNQEDTSNKPILSYIPENTALVVSINNHEEFKNTLKNNEFLSELKSTKLYSNILEKVKFLDYIHPESKGVLALSKGDQNEFNFLYITENTWNLIQLDDTQRKTQKDTVQSDSSIQNYTIEGTSFYSLRKNQKAFVSSSKLILEKFDDNQTGIQTEEFKKLYSIANKDKSATVLINMNKSDLLFTAAEKKNSNLPQTKLSDWISLDINDDFENFNLTGVGISNDSTNNTMNLFANTKPLTNKTALYAPAKTASILSYTFDDYSTFAKNREKASGIVSPIEPAMNTVEEIGIIHLDNQIAVVLNTYGSESISEYLMTQKKKTNEYQGQEIIELLKTDFLNNRFSPIVSDFDSKFCVLLKNAFVFSTDENVIKTIIRDYKNANTFHKTAIFQTLNNDIAQESSILFISSSKNIETTIKDKLSSDFASEIKELDLSNYGFAVQTIADNNFYHTSTIVNKIGSPTRKTTASSSRASVIELNTKIATNPQFVTNHLTGRQEIIVQDENNVLYLISDKGKVLWKKQLSSLIQGEIQQVDIFKNGRLQLAFTTNNQFMILDRNGNEVKKFTKTYEGGNLNPLAIFDYEKKKNYRFVVTQGNNTYMYNPQAQIVKGFKYTKAEHPIVSAPKHIVIKNKDFLVFKLKDGSLKLLNRVGDVRVKVDKKFDFSNNEVFVYKNKFAVTDQKGILHQIDLNGEIVQTNFNLSSDHGMATSENTLVLMNDNLLTIKGKKVELELGVYTSPKIFYLNNKIYVSVTDLQNEKVYLFDSQAKPIPNFPILGSSAIHMASMSKSKAIELVTIQDQSSLVRYKVN